MTDQTQKNDQCPSFPAPSLCWACHQTIRTEHFCPGCAKVQPLPMDANFFEMMDLPVRLNMEANELERRYYNLSRQLHPDFFQQTSEIERKISLDRFAAINQAYHTLRTLRGRTRYLLAIQRGGMGFTAVRTDTPKSLLMTVFELQEATEELAELDPKSSPAEYQAARERILEIQQELGDKESASDAGLRKIADAWDQAQEQAAPPETINQLLNEMQALLDEQSYLNRLRDNVAQALGDDACPARA